MGLRKVLFFCVFACSVPALAEEPGLSIPTTAQVGADRVYQSIKISYVAGSRKQSLQGTFREGHLLGTTLRLVAPSQFKINGVTIPIDENWWGTINYELDKTGALVQKKIVEWTAGDGKIYRNVLFVRPATPLAPAGSVRRSRDLRLQWRGEALGADEALTATVQTAASGGAYASFSVRVDSSDEHGVVTIPATELAKLPVGRAQLELHRSSGGRLTESTSAGGRYHTSYFSKAVKIKITN
ncbi:MAG: hypothetical protein IT285_01525 [Bdellovibrionales bacterium]|nr:hypothetical protein [Bdellovibrionales bacterium]